MKNAIKSITMRKYAAEASELRLLIYKYTKGQLTMNEKRKLDDFMNRSPENASLVELLISPQGPALLLKRQARLEKVWKGHSFKKLLNKYRRKRRRPFMQMPVIIAIVLMLVLGAAYFLIMLLAGK